MPPDVPLILSLINELAEYEKLRHESVATEASIHQALFGTTPRAEAIIARFDGEPAGFALFFIISRPFSASRACIWRICSCAPRFAAARSANRC